MYTKNVDTPTSIVTSINEQVGGITISQESLGFDKEIIKKADVGHTHDYAGSTTAGGPATSAKKLNTDAGSSTNPVYFKDGVPVAIQYEIKASVPMDAQFTDTTYEATTGETPGLIKLYDEIGNNTDGAMTQAAINNISSTMADKSTVVNKTLLASNWVCVYDNPLPQKGDLILMDLDGNGDKEYRVLKINGNIAECLSMYDNNNRCKFGSNNTYSDSTLDTALNTTFYNTLSSAAKAAIVPKNIIQYQYTYGNVYNETTHASDANYSTKIQKAVVGNRYVYALDIEDIEEYFNNTFSVANVRRMFWNIETEKRAWVWLRSSYDYDSNGVWIVNGYSGRLFGYGITDTNEARPAFQIDLSKITFKGTSAPYRYELSVDGVTETSNQEIMPADGITDEQMYHLQGANLQDGGQDTNKIVLEAFGVKPSIDIPIKIIMRKD